MINHSHQPVFIRGAIPFSLIHKIITRYGADTRIGAYNFFLGQVRNDEVNGSRVWAIEYTTQTAIAMEKLQDLQAALVEKYALVALQVYHSLGTVRAGEICFFVLAVAGHRREAFAACSEAVERIKSELPVWGKLLLENEAVQWKEND
jgi:molybdopterin synthase catalytic subunit